VLQERCIAFILGNAIHCVDHLLRAAENLTMGGEQGINAICQDLSWNSDRFGGTLAESKSSIAIVRGALALYGSGRREAARDVVGNAPHERSLRRCIGAHRA
jgi:hypothetical protein